MRELMRVENGGKGHSTQKNTDYVIATFGQIFGSQFFNTSPSSQNYLLKVFAISMFSWGVARKRGNDTRCSGNLVVLQLEVFVRIECNFKT